LLQSRRTGTLNLFVRLPEQLDQGHSRLRIFHARQHGRGFHLQSGNARLHGMDERVHSPWPTRQARGCRAHPPPVLFMDQLAYQRFDAFLRHRFFQNRHEVSGERQGAIFASDLSNSKPSRL
jgi:hypothetical protein